ncbi:hypothetical protein [Kitasatospora viridis]|uniref:HEAT repeat protein n=1 Tax=Kitasatospora viridis TaxID=281105 RepID=A0A561UDF8_9ACTN|nr:hypothetical protein [Kitasatospora viridis]TWF97368.1 hypothetical protein FHX73_111148 [Kitasatospora viridis]
MRSPAELDHVQWHELTHAYGSAEDVPEQVRALYEPDEELVEEAIYALYGNIHHQGSVYQASAPAVPFLAHAAMHVPGRRADLLMLLATLAEHEPQEVDSPHWAGSSVAAICVELVGVLPDLLPCLTDAEREVRQAALRVVAAVAGLLLDELRERVVARVEELYDGDPVAAVRADALMALDRFGRAVAGLDSPLPEVRLAVALLAAERAEPPYPAELVAVLAADGAEPDPGDEALQWNGSSQEERLTRLLARDPDAGLTVAAGWIAAGDLGSRGSWLARTIADTWRDREAEVLRLLLAAVRQEQDVKELYGPLRAVSHWVDLVAHPAPELRDALHDYAYSPDEDVAEVALLALIRSRDPRAVELVLRRPNGRLLAAAAHQFPGAAEQLIPEIRRLLAAGATGNAGIALVRALAPLGAAARQAQPELVDCLRTSRAAIVAARQLGVNGVAAAEVVEVLREATGSTDDSVRAAAATAHYRLTGEAAVALGAFEELIAGGGQLHWFMAGLEPLGRAAEPLLPLIEPLLTADYEWTRLAAAQTHHWITGSPDRAVPVLAELVVPKPVGLEAMAALASTGRVPAELRPALEHFASSPVRLIADSPVSGEGHPDEELRTLARRLLDAC